MSRYYLMAQLPSLDNVGDATPLPITEERFYELCERFLGKNVVAQLARITLVPAREEEKISSPLIDGWNTAERQLRLALNACRTEKLKKASKPETDTVPAALLQVARTAVELDNPLAAEQLLQQHRLKLLEALRPMDPFCEDAVYYYGLKLKLLTRMKQFDQDKGAAVYRNIYDAIMNGEQEAIQ